MYYYKVNRIERTTEEGTAFYPDIPENISFVGHDDGNTFLIATPLEIPNNTTLTDVELQNECWYRGLNYDDVLKWYVG